MIYYATRILAAVLSLVLFATPANAETWHRADTYHFRIYSDGSAGQVESFAHEVEKFDALLRMLFNRPLDAEPTKLTIYLLEDSRDVARLADSRAAGFYSVRLEDTFAVGNREYGAEKDDLTGKEVLLHEYAHHFMYHNFSIPTPTWFSEGFAEFVATAQFKRNGDWTFGEPAHHRAYSVQNGPTIPIEMLLTADYGKMTAEEMSAFYGWAWALTHMLYSDPDERGRQIVRYLNDINGGMENLDAARKNFGDLDELEPSLRSYVRKSMPYSKSDKAIPYRDEIAVETLTDSESELQSLTLLRMAARDDTGLREEIAGFAEAHPSAEAWRQLGEIEFAQAHRAGSEEDGYDFSSAQAAVDRALALDPDHSRANTLAGRLKLEAIDHGDHATDADWDAARAYFLKGNKGDPYDALPLYLYAHSLQRQGRRDPMIGPALENAFRFRPEATEMRSALASHYANEGRYESAIALIRAIANDPHKGGEWAQKFIDQLERARDGGAGIVAVPVDGGEGEE